MESAVDAVSTGSPILSTALLPVAGAGGCRSSKPKTLSPAPELLINDAYDWNKFIISFYIFLMVGFRAVANDFENLSAAYNMLT